MTDTCPLLGRPTRTRVTPYGREGYEVVRCLETGFVFLRNPPGYEAVRDDFPWEVTQQQERRRRRAAEPLLSRVSDAAKALKRRFQSRRNRMFTLASGAIAQRPASAAITLLDVGCGCGGLAIDCCERFEAAGRRATPIGLEISPALAQAAGERFASRGGSVVLAPATEGALQLDDASIDLALLSSFLEHDPRPLELLRALRGKLAAGGAVVVKSPNFASLNRRVRGRRWCGFRFPDHVNYFTPATLARLAAEAGYRVEPGSWRDRAPLSDNLYGVLRAA